MPKFAYKAKKSPTEIDEGTVIADNKTSAIRKISEKGYYILSIEESHSQDGGATGGTGFVFQRRINLSDITNFTRQLSDLLDSGLTIVKALDILENQTENKRVKNVLTDIKGFCVEGHPLSQAMARHPRVFSNLFVSMVRSGETGGALDNILKRLADFSDKQLEVQTKVRSALAYPILMALVGGMTVIVLLTFVIPKMVTMFGDLGQSLPLPTLVLISISGAIKRYWWLIGSAIFAIYFFVSRIYRTKEGRFAIDNFKMGLPVFGSLIKKIEIARFARTLSTLLANGVPILESLAVVADTVNNAVIKEEIRRAASQVKEGSNLAGAFSKSAIIPPLVVNMIAVGEESGKVDKSLAKVSEGYDRESDAAIKIMMSLLEPAMILVLGVVVGFIVISMLLPIFEINFLAR